MKNPFRRRKSVPEQALEMITRIHSTMEVNFRSHGYTEAESRDLADIAVEGWLEYVRESM